MFARILVAIDDFSQSQAVLDLAKGAATEGAVRGACAASPGP